MQRFLALVGAVTWLLLAGAAAADVQSARQRWQQLLDREAQFFAPKTYDNAQRAMAALEGALRKSASGGGAELQRVEKQLTELEQHVDRAQALWADVLAARAAARDAGAVQAGIEVYTQAENTLDGAARKLEAGRREAAQRQVEPARALYVQAEQQAHRFQLVGRTRQILARCEAQQASRYTPRSYVRAADAAARAEQLLAAYGPDDVRVREHATEAARQALHTLDLLDHIRRTCADGSGALLESKIVDWEDALRILMQTLELQTNVEKGMKEPLETAQVAAEQLVRERNRLRADLSTRLADNDSLQKELRAARQSVRDIEGRVAELTAYEREARAVEQIQARFTQGEGRVLVENRDVILRLHGLRFSSGEAELSPGSEGLLEKVIASVREIPGAFLIIEGHTDAEGPEATNLELSRQRANQVRDYLIREAGIDADLVSTVGYGSARPVATNETEEGRTLNRRIEITISRPG